MPCLEMKQGWTHQVASGLQLNPSTPGTSGHVKLRSVADSSILAVCKEKLAMRMWRNPVFDSGTLPCLHVYLWNLAAASFMCHAAVFERGLVNQPPPPPPPRGGNL